MTIDYRDYQEWAHDNARALRAELGIPMKRGNICHCCREREPTRWYGEGDVCRRCTGSEGAAR